MTRLTIALLQLPNSSDIAQNTSIADRAILECARMGASLIVFPECFLTGFTAKTEPCTPEALEPSLARLEVRARAAGVTAVLPSACRVDERTVENTGWWLGPGERTAFIKTGLTDSERHFFSAERGPGVRTHRVGAHVMGLVVCREVEDPPSRVIPPEDEVDCVLWPGYIRWDPDTAWGQGEGLMAGAIRMASRLGAPLLQANYCFNDASTARHSGPNGRSVVVDAAGVLMHRAPESAPSCTLVELSERGLLCTDAALES